MTTARTQNERLKYVGDFYSNLCATLFKTFRAIINFQTTNLFTLFQLSCLQEVFLTLNLC